MGPDAGDDLVSKSSGWVNAISIWPPWICYLALLLSSREVSGSSTNLYIIKSCLYVHIETFKSTSFFTVSALSDIEKDVLDQ